MDFYLVSGQEWFGQIFVAAGYPLYEAGAYYDEAPLSHSPFQHRMGTKVWLEHFSLRRM